MTQLRIIVGGETTYDGDIPATHLPSAPALYPAALRSLHDPSAPRTPLARAVVLTALLAGVCRTLETLGVTTEIHTYGVGNFTLTGSDNTCLTATAPPADSHESNTNSPTKENCS
jgi:hypothetical protein